MENLDIYKKKEKVEFDNKVDFFNYHKNLFKIISLVLGNVVLEYQLMDLLLTMEYFETEREFIDFMNNCKKFDLLKNLYNKDKEEIRFGDKRVYIAKDYVIQNVYKSKTKKPQYKYSEVDAKLSYFKMFYILEVAKSRKSCVKDFSVLANVLVNYTTLGIGKSQSLKLYEKLYDKKMLNTQGEIALEDLKNYEAYKNLKFKKMENLNNLNETELEKIKCTYERLVGNNNFWDYSLGKVSDNKSYFMFFNQKNTQGYKTQAPDTLDIVKFDVSGNFGNAELGDYIAKVMESIKMHIKEECRNINMYIYFENEDARNRIFTNSVNQKLNRNGVRNLDSNLTARIKETCRKVYQCRLVNFVDPKVDFNNCTVSYKIFYKSQNTAPDDFYTLTLHFKNVDFENDIYSKEDIEKKQIEEENRRNQRKVDEIINDPELMSLMIERLMEIRK